MRSTEPCNCVDRGDNVASKSIDFGIRLPDIFIKGFAGYGKNIIPLSFGALLTLGSYAPFRFFAQQLQDGNSLTFRSIGVDIVGLVIAGTLAYPWYAYALRAYRGEEISLGAPFAEPKKFLHQAVASFFFWAGFMLGIRYPIFGIPILSILVLVSYAFHGFVVADTPLGGKKKKRVGGATYALGTSVRLGEKRRFGLFAIASLFMMFNVLGAAFGFAVGNTLLQYVIGVVGLSITTSVTMVGGAYIYDELVEKLPKGEQNTVVNTRAKKKRDKKRG